MITSVKSPGTVTATTAASNERAWSFPTRATASDNLYAFSAFLSDSQPYSAYLKATNFGFSIPSGATILGVKVQIERKSSSVSGRYVVDNTIQLIVGGSADGDNEASSDNWPTIDTIKAYGSETELWGLSLTPAQINSSDFGVQIRVQRSGASGSSITASVDHVQITVYYSLGYTMTVESTDRTGYVSWQTLTKDDIINSQVDTCSFETMKYGSKTWKPAVGDEVLLEYDGEKLFAGVIVRTEEVVDGLLLKYRVECKDWTHYLDRVLVNERYEEMTIEDIIDDINTNYLTGFTITNASCVIEVKSIAFNRLPASRCLQILAEQVNYNWYVDYDKDIHFFAKNSENAPFNLTDTNGKYVFSSLMIQDDLSQMRNRVFIRGGEIEASAREENFTGDGTKKTFALGYKFSEKPTVTVGGAAKTVGIDYLDQDADYDSLWNYNEKYLRFVSAPAASSAIVVSGIPLIPLIVQVQDDASIAEYGVYEFCKVDKTIKTTEEARQYANSQLEAYGSKIQEAVFDTRESGLRSGQVINIQSDIRGIDEDFLIQKVTFSMRTPTEGFWTVELATMRTMGIIDFLQKLLLAQDKQITVAENEIIEKSYVDSQTVRVTEEIEAVTPEEDFQTVSVAEDIVKDPLGADTEPDWVLGPYAPSGHTDTKREMRMDVTSFVYS